MCYAFQRHVREQREGDTMGTAARDVAVLSRRAVIVTSVLVALTQPLLAHEGEGVVGGFVSGSMHPLTGPDHIAAMVAVGLWGAFLGAPAIWLLPIVFPTVMSIGGVLGVLRVGLPYVETGIALSAVILGLLVSLAARPPIWVAAAIVGAFAIFHGHAHGIELPQAANPLSYSAGFVLATGALHLTGIAFGSLAKWRLGRGVVRTAGAAIAFAGIFFLIA
jgi:urease accessory protein